MEQLVKTPIKLHTKYVLRERRVCSRIKKVPKDSPFCRQGAKTRRSKSLTGSFLGHWSLENVVGIYKDVLVVALKKTIESSCCLMKLFVPKGGSTLRKKSVPYPEDPYQLLP